jgi:predicted nuclease of predicted toxin-antitoxin system
MVRLYADENFPLVIVELLRTFGHDVLTVQEAGNAGLGIPDEDVLAFAISHNRAVLTRNWDDFRHLHRLQPDHKGIIICKEDLNTERQATLINEAISTVENLTGKLIRVIRPPQ